LKSYPVEEDGEAEDQTLKFAAAAVLDLDLIRAKIAGIYIISTNDLQGSLHFGLS
jgi:hypothetical protein